MSRGHFVDYLLERPDVAPLWERFLYHPFVLGLGNGKLPLGSFKKYLIQDYLYLVRSPKAGAVLRVLIGDEGAFCPRERLGVLQGKEHERHRCGTALGPVDGDEHN